MKSSQRGKNLDNKVVGAYKGFGPDNVLMQEAKTDGPCIGRDLTYLQNPLPFDERRGHLKEPRKSLGPGGGSPNLAHGDWRPMRPTGPMVPTRKYLVCRV